MGLLKAQWPRRILSSFILIYCARPAGYVCSSQIFAIFGAFRCNFLDYCAIKRFLGAFWWYLAQETRMFEALTDAF